MAIDEEKRAKHLKEFDELGFTVIEDAITTDFADELYETLMRLENERGTQAGTNVFEGHKTIRLYNLMQLDPVFRKIPEHPEALELVDEILSPECLINTISSISILPGEKAQPIHADDQLIPIAKPHGPIVVNTMWALTDFTEENGATRVAPGTQHGPDPEIYQEVDTIQATMKKGSILVFNGSVWHSGGANNSDKRRVGIAMNYCAGYLRQEENQQLSLPQDLVRTFSPRLRKLVGYGTFNYLIGNMDKLSPVEAIWGEKDDSENIWDKLGG